MAIVLALLIVGWLVAFALGAQSGFDNQPEAQPTVQSTVQTKAADAATVGYREPASVA
ncbi:MAG: hypothetical protein AAFY54_01700 [Cyanobacteria bacterium J06648_10]